MQNEFARPFKVERLRGGSMRLQIEADAAERAALIDRFDLVALDRLEADLTIRAGAGGTVRLSGRLIADATQACIATLEPVPAPLDVAFEMSFAEDAADDGLGEIVIDMDAEDSPDPIENGEIDLGEAVVQQMAVALDPYPRSPDAPSFDDDDPDSADGNGPDVEPAPARPSPFAVLRRKG